jgi:purine-nucleoside phosphorylase
MTLKERIAQATDFIRPQLSHAPDIVLVLGSGLNALAQDLKAQASFAYGDIPHFKAAGAPGHTGRLLFGELFGQQVVVMQGRLHAYEGHSAADIVFPLRVLQALGAKTLIMTNASGGINDSFDVGDIMLVKDHINFTGMNPLTLSLDTGISDFIDMTYTYTPALQEKALKAASACGIKLQQGVYLGLRGPSFETPAEIRAFRAWGADAVGMSTVLEVIAACALKMDVCCLAMISNKAAGMLDQPLSGDDILEASKIAADNMELLIRALLQDGVVL